jgi:hypothetical protein
MTSGPLSASRCPSSQAPSQHAMALDRAELRLSASPTRKPTVALARVPELSRAHVALGEAACRTAAAQSITTPPVKRSLRTRVKRLFANLSQPKTAGTSQLTDVLNRLGLGRGHHRTD